MTESEEILRSQFSPYEWDELMENCGVDVTPSVLAAMEEYAKLKQIEALMELISSAGEVIEVFSDDSGLFSKGVLESYKRRIKTYRDAVNKIKEQ